MKYEWADPFILFSEDAAPWASEVIKTAEEIDRWHPAVVGKDKKSTVRDNDITLISGSFDPRWSDLESKILKLTQDMCKEYFRKHDYIRLSRAGSFDLLRYKAGQHYGKHVDNPLTKFLFIKRQLSLVVYLNDDFKGGELTFPNQNIYINPKPGAALLIPSNFCYSHQAQKVTEGTKYAVVTFILTEPDDEPEEASKI